MIQVDPLRARVLSARLEPPSPGFHDARAHDVAIRRHEARNLAQAIDEPSRVLLVEPQADELENFSAQFERNGFDIRQAAASDRGAGAGQAASSIWCCWAWPHRVSTIAGYAAICATPTRHCHPGDGEAGDEFESALMLELGADACIDRGSSPRLVAAQIRSLLRRRRVVAAVHIEAEPNDGVIRFGRLELLPFAYQVRVDGLHVHVPTRPFQALTILSGRPNEVVSREQLDPASAKGAGDGTPEKVRAPSIRALRDSERSWAQPVCHRM